MPRCPRRATRSAASTVSWMQPMPLPRETPCRRVGEVRSRMRGSPPHRSFPPALPPPLVPRQRREPRVLQRFGRGGEGEADEIDALRALVVAGPLVQVERALYRAARHAGGNPRRHLGELLAEVVRIRVHRLQFLPASASAAAAGRDCEQRTCVMTSPRHSLRQLTRTPMPRGETSPAPVTTTRLPA